MKFKSEIERFEEKYHPEPNTGCWIWLGGCVRHKYPVFYATNGICYASRFSYEFKYGSIPDRKRLIACKNSFFCINPEHLQLWEELTPLEKIYQYSHPEPNSSCWLWVGNTDENKKRGGSIYGSMVVNGKHQKSHRVSYEAFKGLIPNGLEIDHRCNTPLCVNPEHLEAITPQENFLKSNNPPAQNKRKTHCLNGHPLFGDNLYIAPGGNGRACRVCVRKNTKNWLMRKNHSLSI